MLPKLWEHWLQAWWHEAGWHRAKNVSIVHGESWISPHKLHYMASPRTLVATRGLQTTEVLPGRVNSIHAITAHATATAVETSDAAGANTADAAAAYVVRLDADADYVGAAYGTREYYKMYSYTSMSLIQWTGYGLNMLSNMTGKGCQEYRLSDRNSIFGK